MVNLTREEKQKIAMSLADYLPQLRMHLGCTQADFAELCGISKERLSRIENKHYVMSWTQTLAVLAVLALNKHTAGELLEFNLVDSRLVSFLQRKDMGEEPELDTTGYRYRSKNPRRKKEIE